MRPLLIADIESYDAQLQRDLRQRRFEGVHFDAFVRNTRLGPRRYAELLPIIGDQMPTPRGFRLGPAGLERDEAHSPTAPAYASLDDLFNCCDEFFRPLAARGIAVQCSGGLDSTILAAILRVLGIPFALIGLRTDRYEFRTERRVQESIAEMTDRFVLLDHDQVLPMSGLGDVPPHGLPSLSSLTYACEAAMAGECRRAGIGVMVSGAGGDALLADPVSSDPNDWPIQIFADWWQQQYIYRPSGVDLVYPFADPRIAGTIWRLRAGEGDDPKKRWARHAFRDHLPSILTHYTYKSDHWGVHSSGLLQNIEHIVEIHDRARGLCAREFFMPEPLQALLGKDVHAQDQELHLGIEARMALATWVCSVMTSSD
jgi:hypothetical protein